MASYVNLNLYEYTNKPVLCLGAKLSEDIDLYEQYTPYMEKSNKYIIMIRFCLFLGFWCVVLSEDLVKSWKREKKWT